VCVGGGEGEGEGGALNMSFVPSYAKKQSFALHASISSTRHMAAALKH